MFRLTDASHFWNFGLFVIEGANHYPQIDHASAFDAWVILFLQKALAEMRQAK